MEFFLKGKTIRLRSHLDKYLIADEDHETVLQHRNGLSRKARWTVEHVEGKTSLIRLKTYDGHYLAASEAPLLLGMTGKKVIQTHPKNLAVDPTVEWEPIRDGFQVKLKTFCGKFLRANGGPPPWRNTVTHDNPLQSKAQDWILWDVEEVEFKESDLLSDYLTSMSSFSSLSDELVVGSVLGSPVSIISIRSPKPSSKRIGMEFFNNAKAVRLRSHHDKYLLAEEDEESVTQDRNGSSKNARWTVEISSSSSPPNIIRLKSCYGKYLTASNQPFLLGMTGHKVLQTQPKRLDSSVEWEPIREGNHLKLKTRYGNFLRANGGLPPWRNSVTHDIPHRTATQDWILWSVDVVEIEVNSSKSMKPPHEPALEKADSIGSESSSPSSLSIKSGNFARQESSDSMVGSPPKVGGGRTIYYHIGGDNGNVEEAIEGQWITFKGNGVDELRQRLEEETGLDDVIVCSRSPLTGKLYPLKLQLPPNNATMHVVVVESSSRVAREFAKSGLL
ncbi:protein of unknown function DUF569 [Dillenia turbinata]|uniref:DUF569 domain-containing protein n=1 Tax=Dillenia turbinata TaxID=194707 RepID=A0AAN8Z2H4_9MAGN